MKTQVEVNGKIFKVGDIITAKGNRDCTITAITDYSIVRNIGEENCGGEFISSFDLLQKHWSVKKPDRKKIELKAYVCDYGNIRYYTENGERLYFYRNNNLLHKSSYKNKFSLVKELPSKFIWADTLEYCDSEAGRVE